MTSLYLAGRVIDSHTPSDPVERRLQRVGALLDAILQSDRSRYLEARTWLLNSIAVQSPPAAVRLACWAPLLTEALAAPATPPPPLDDPSAARRYERQQGHHVLGGDEQAELGHSGPQQLPGRGDLPGRNASRAGGGGDAPLGSVPGPMEQLTQLLMLVSEVWPDRVASLLLDRPQVFVDFFQGPGSSRRILLWFSHFSMDGMRAFKYGSYALAHYTLAHRDEVWDLLRWEGKHAQAPVAVAAKTHYFCELALVPSVRSLLRHHPQFWASEQWRECCRDGAVLELDRRHFCEVLLNDLRAGGRGISSESGAVAARLAALLRDFLSAPPPPGAPPSHGHPYWQLLCQRLLHQLDERQLLRLVNTLAAGQRLQAPPAAGAGFVAAATSLGSPGAASSAEAGGAAPNMAVVAAYAGTCGEGGWQDLSGLALRGSAQWGSVAEVILAHALAAARGPLQRLLAEERDELMGRLEEIEQLAEELHGVPGGPGPAEDCTPAAHCALLYGCRLEVAAAGRRCAKDRLLLLTELWTLREALRRSGAAGNFPGREVVIRPGAAATAEAHTSAQVAAAERGAADAASGRSGGRPVGLPLEGIMAELGGVTFERLQRGAEGCGERGRAGGGRAAGPGAFTPSVAAALEHGAAARAGLAAAPEGAQYELLLSEDEDQGGRDARRRRRRRRSKDKSRGRSRKSTKRRRRADGDGRDRHGREHQRRRGRRSRSSSKELSRSRSRTRKGPRVTSGSSGSEDERARGAHRHRDKRAEQRRRRKASHSDSSRSSSRSSSSSSGSTIEAMSTSGSDSDSEGRSHEPHRERCGSSGLGGSAGDRNPHGRSRSGSGLRDSRRSSTLAAFVGGSSYGARREDSDELAAQDPIALLRGDGITALGQNAERNGGMVWRVRLPGGGGAGGSGAPAGATGTIGGGAATTTSIEMVGCCDDIADLLAAIACKHWVAAMLASSTGAERRHRAPE